MWRIGDVTGSSCGGVPFAGVDDAGGDAQNSMDERDLNVAVPVGASLDERQSGQDPFGVGEVLARRRVWVFGIHGPESFRSRPRLGAYDTGRGRHMVQEALPLWHGDGMPRTADRYAELLD